MMKGDVLNGFENIKICTEYKLGDGNNSDQQYLNGTTEGIQPVYETMKGWNCSLEGITKYEDFPEELKAYVTFLEKELQVPIKMVSVGPDRKQTILK
jgi:adenylosuccinate synthase